jgi:hypothetical protein
MPYRTAFPREVDVPIVAFVPPLRDIVSICTTLWVATTVRFCIAVVRGERYGAELLFAFVVMALSMWTMMRSGRSPS